MFVLVKKSKKKRKITKEKQDAYVRKNMILDFQDNVIIADQPRR